MGRDPEYLAFMKIMAKANAGQSQLTVAEERIAHADALANVPRPPVAEARDLTVAGAAGPLRARLYRPAGTGRRAGEFADAAVAGRAAASPNGGDTGLVFFHGGGWYLGDVESYDPVARALANATRTTLISVDYRLAPEHPFPAPFDDAYAATCWVAAHTAELGLRRIGVAGDSAGGNLAAAVTLRARAEAGPRLALQLLVYPAVDLTTVPEPVTDPDGLLLDDGGMVHAVGNYLDGADPARPYVSPLSAPDLGGLPPAVVATAEYDKLRAQGEAYARRLATAGVPVSLVPGTGLDHGFLGWGSFARRPAEAIEEIGAAVRARLVV